MLLLMMALAGIIGGVITATIAFSITRLRRASAAEGIANC